jgi:DNA-binding transcriptional LysR family regulator
MAAIGVVLRAKAKMDIKDLQFFIAVYDARSFSRAASNLDTVQSNVSARILALEKHLGALLFERLPRAVVPTRRAKRLYGQARRVVAALARIERSARRRRRGGSQRRQPQALR